MLLSSSLLMISPRQFVYCKKLSTALSSTKNTIFESNFIGHFYCKIVQQKPKEFNE